MKLNRMDVPKKVRMGSIARFGTLKKTAKQNLNLAPQHAPKRVRMETTVQNGVCSK